MGDKEEELEMYLQGYYLICTTMTWWDGFCDCSAAMEEYKLFRRDRQGK